MFLRYTVTLLLFSTSLFTNYNDGNRNGNLSLIHLESASNAIIDGCVNAITGEYFHASSDLHIAGSEPLSLERYLSDKLRFSYGEHAWENFGFNFASKMNSGTNIYVIEGNGGVFDMEHVGKRGKDSEYHLHHNHAKYGVTNFSGERIGRKNHTRYIKTFIDKKRKNGVVEFPSGTQRTYEKIKTCKIESLLPTKEKYPSGASHEYNYTEGYGLSKITLKAPNGEYLSSIDFKYPSKKDLKTHPYFDAIASNGQSVRYHLQNDDKNTRFNITRVEKNHAPFENIKIKYKKDCKQLIRVRRPDNRYREAQLFHYGWQSTRNGSIEIKRNENNGGNSQNWVGKVHRLRAPVGHDDAPIITHEFCYWTPLFYEVDTGILRSGKGSATVYDAEAHKSSYHWNDSFQLERIEKFAGTTTHNLYTTEYFRYDHAGQLTHRYFDKTNEGVLFCREFKYNEHGDVIEDKLWGNLTGRETQKMVRMDNNGPVNNGIDTYSKQYRYTSDRFHNVAYESDGIYENFFEYLPNTDLLTAKFMGGMGKIELREFYQYNGRGELICKISDDGLSRDPSNLQSATLRRIERREYSNGFPVKISEYYYDFSAGTEVLNSRQCFVYNRTGKPLEESHYDSDGNHLYTLHRQYDAHDNLIFATDAMGIATYFSYDLNDNLVTQTREGVVKRNTYDFVNRLIKEEITGDDCYQSQSYRYNHLSLKIGSTDQWGNETTFSYDDFGRPIAEHSPAYLSSNSEIVAPVIRRIHDALGNVIQLTTPSNYTIYSAYTVRGDLIESRDQDGVLQRCEYALNGKLLKKRERSGVETRFGYDFMGRVIREELFDSDGSFIRGCNTSYKGALKISETDVAGITTYYHYNFRGQCIAKESAGLITAYSYDTQGRIICETELDSIKTTAYDNFNRVVEECTDGMVVRKAYDAHGRVVLDQSGESITTTLYNAIGLPIEVTDAEGRTIYTMYDDHFINALGQRVRLVTHTHYNGTGTQIEYNSHGLIARETTLSLLGEPLRHAQYYYESNEKLTETITTVIAENKPSYERKLRMNYDAQGRIISLIDAAGTLEQKTTTYFYNTLGQKICEKQANDIALEYSYDSIGRLQTLQSSDATVNYNYTYDNRDNILSIFDGVHGITTEKSYSLFNLLTKETLGNGLTLHYNYDPSGRLTEMILPDESVVSYTYLGKFLHTVTRGNYTHTYTERNLTGKPISETLPFGDTRSTTFAPTGQKLEILASGFSDQVLNRDISGNVTVRKIQQREDQFLWDQLDQLKMENSLSYVHDSIHNRTKIGDADYSINALNQVTHDGSNGYNYDKNGNLVDGRDMSFEYDGLNRLIAAHTPSGSFSYIYDAENRRIISRGVETTLFYYFGMNELGSISPTQTSLRVFGEGEGAERNAGVLFELNGELFEPLYDLLGNVIALRDKNGVMVEEYKYDMFGVGSGEGLSPWKYSSKRLDRETGFFYFGHRFYDSVLGRWVTADPKGYSAGPNLYAYVMNNPVAHMDQYGLEAETPERGRLKSGYKAMRTGKNKLIPNVLCINSVPKPEARDNNECTKEAPQSKIDSSSALNDQEWTLYSLDIDKEPKEHFIVFFNGICNPLKDAVKSAKRISETHGNMNVYILHNKTKGALLDILGAGLQMAGNYDSTCQKVESGMKQLFGMFSEKQCLAIAHSKGVLILDRVLKQLPSEMRRRTFAITFGGAAIIEPYGLAGVINFVSSRDAVPYICSGFKLLGHAFNKREHIQILDGQGIYGTDHAFASPTYQKQLKHSVMFFKNHSGK